MLKYFGFKRIELYMFNWEWKIILELKMFVIFVIKIINKNMIYNIFIKICFVRSLIFNILFVGLYK